MKQEYFTLYLKLTIAAQLFSPPFTHILEKYTSCTEMKTDAIYSSKIIRTHKILIREIHAFILMGIFSSYQHKMEVIYGWEMMIVGIMLITRILGQAW